MKLSHCLKMSKCKFLINFIISNPLKKKIKQSEEKKIINENVVNLDPHAKRLKDLYSVLDNHDLTKAYQETLLSEKEKKTEAKKFEGKQPKF